MGQTPDVQDGTEMRKTESLPSVGFCVEACELPAHTAKLVPGPRSAHADVGSWWGRASAAWRWHLRVEGHRHSRECSPPEKGVDAASGAGGGRSCVWGIPVPSLGHRHLAPGWGARPLVLTLPPSCRWEELDWLALPGSQPRTLALAAGLQPCVHACAMGQALWSQRGADGRPRGQEGTAQ